MNRTSWVVETLINRGARIPLWAVWSAHRVRSYAWVDMRCARERYPAEKFRVVKYVPESKS